MRFSALLLLTVLVGLSGPAWAGKLGVGVMVGEPTGLNAKAWLDNSHALDFGVAWSLNDHERLHLHIDYLFHNFAALKGSGLDGKLALYWGLGGRLQVRDEYHDNHGNDHDYDGEDELGVRIPLGLDWVLPRAPVDFFLEVAPVVNLVPDTDLDVEGGIGVRFWFR
ncbi:MAG: hypothetical protein WC326_00270 [Candidatus Delongbacteria bacterium]